MLPRSYLIFAPATPNEIGAAEMNQRQSIPLAWAFAFASPTASLTTTDDHIYFSTTVGDALAMLDRGLAAWNYNSYFRDTLAPIHVFRTWLANHPSETRMYMNITELIKRSPNRQQDLEELGRLSEKVMLAYDEVEQKHFTNFLQELRKLSYPLVTVPITGDREVDVNILKFEMRDTDSVEAEMALQMVGVDRDVSLLQQATESIVLRRGKMAKTTMTESILVAESLTLFTNNLGEARALLVDELGCTVMRAAKNRIVLRAHGREFQLLRLDEDYDVTPEEEG